jgi:release factor glutamine methyltransferase
VRQSVATLERAGFGSDEGRRDAAVIARTLIGWDQSRWLSGQHEQVPPGLAGALDTMIQRRALREPIAYIIGEREFYGRVFSLTPDVLIPRPETELVIDEALRILTGPLRVLDTPEVLDVGTGSGCLALTMALEKPDARVVATDISQQALRIAERNAARLGGAATRVVFEHTSLAGDRERVADLVLSNPPYVAEADREALPRDVREFEPAAALFGGPDGLDVIRALLPAAQRALRPGGWLVMEIGSDQAESAARLTATAGLTLERVARDLDGHPRVVTARKLA